MSNFEILNRDAMLAAGICYSNRKLALLSKQARWRQVRIETGKLLETFAMQVYKRLSLELLIQCGANEPSSAVSFCQIRSGNRAICFEANPYIAQKYMTHYFLKNFAELACALKMTSWLQNLELKY